MSQKNQKKSDESFENNNSKTVGSNWADFRNFSMKLSGNISEICKKNWLFEKVTCFAP